MVARRLVPPLPLVALVAVAAIDVVLGRGGHPALVIGVLDEPAHLMTAVVLALAIVPRRSWTAVAVPLALGSVLIDLDHLPLYLLDASAPAGRPATHSLMTVLVLVALATVRPWRTTALGLAAGVALHLIRDLATGPGVPLFWPVDTGAVLVPHTTYLVVLGLAALIATARLHRLMTTRPTHPPTTVPEGM